MSRSNILRAVGVLGISGLALAAMPSAPQASFEVRPGSPSARAEVRFVDRTPGLEGTSWLWTFGDGQGSTAQSPTHVYEVPGSYPVSLRVTDANGVSVQTTSVVEVADQTTLVLLSQTGHPFEVSLVALNPNPANGLPLSEQATAVPQNDVFGFFTFPTLVPQAPGAPLVPEVFVKMLDARPIPGQDFWVFWGGLTSLEYTLTVRDTVRGTIKTFQNPVTGNPACLSADTSGFAASNATATPTPTVSGVSPTPTPTPTPPSGATRVVEIHSNFFRDRASQGGTTTIDVGTKVEWEWESGFHSTTSGPCPPCNPDSNWDSQPRSSGTFDHTFVEADRGKTFPYFCRVHGSMMTGRVVVNP